MATYVYCPRGSDGAFALVKALPATRLRKFDGLNFWDKAKPIKPEPGSAIICWGCMLPNLDGFKVLNSQQHKWVDKYQQAVALQQADIPTIATIPVGHYSAARMIEAGYIKRTKDHTGGLDLLNPNTTPEFWVKKQNFKAEYRIHSFNGRSIRAGQKVPIEGFTPVEERRWKANAGLLHPWVRSWDGGWKVSYNNFKSTAPMRALAAKAVKALGLTFGAVDIAEDQSGQLWVLEVNSAPGIEGNTIEAYKKAIERWISQPVVVEAEE